MKAPSEKLSKASNLKHVEARSLSSTAFRYSAVLTQAFPILNPGIISRVREEYLRFRSNYACSLLVALHYLIWNLHSKKRKSSTRAGGNNFHVIKFYASFFTLFILPRAADGECERTFKCRLIQDRRSTFFTSQVHVATS
jgi:hypothetical protein